MKIHQIRNATIIITYNNKRFLIDPWLMPKDFMPGFEGAMNSKVRQPRVDLPKDFDINHLPLDAIILTHFHPDHFDEFAVKALDKNIPFYVQNEIDLNIIKNFGFNDVRIISENGTDFERITLYKTQCQHGRREVVKPMCEQIGMPYDAMGIVFKSDEGERLIMDIEDVKAISNYAKNSIIIASHMDTVSHLTVTREDIKSLKLNNVVVPDDNEILEFDN